jgi:hypothetical protein
MNQKTLPLVIALTYKRMAVAGLLDEFVVLTLSDRVLIDIKVIYKYAPFHLSVKPAAHPRTLAADTITIVLLLTITPKRYRTLGDKYLLYLALYRYLKGYHLQRHDQGYSMR